MAGYEDGDTTFVDDFPDIPDDELLRLEQNAISLTQQEPGYDEQQHDSLTNKITIPPRVQRRDLSVLATHPATLPRHTLNGQPNYRAADALRQDSSNGTILDEDGLPLVVEVQQRQQQQQHRNRHLRTPLDETTQREQWRVNRFAGPQAPGLVKQSTAVSDVRLNPHQSALYTTHDIRESSMQPVVSARSNGVNPAVRQSEDEVFRARVAELMRERDELTNSLHKAKDEVTSRRGEIANIRQKQLTEEKTYQRQIAALQRSKQEESEKHAASIQAMNAESKRVASEIQFLKQELKEESRKVQSFQRQLKDKPLADKSSNANTTPKRNHALRDGFDDDEMMIISPVKSGRRSKPGTPTANRKRKQPTGADVSVQPLALRLSGTRNPSELQETADTAKFETIGAVTVVDLTARRHLQVLQSVTTFRPSESEEPLVEQLLKLFFPSDHSKSLGWMFLDATSKLEGQRFSGDLIQIFIDLWARAKQEKYYTCIGILVDTIAFTIDHDPFAIDAAMVSSILPVLQSTIEVNAVARFQLMRKEYLTVSGPKPAIDISIDNTACLRLLHTIACLVSDDDELISLLWRSVSTDFVLMMLNACQAISEITLMLRVLATSILPDTFGMICEATQQSKYESYICDRLCYLLWEVPKSDANCPPYSSKQICLLRKESLDLLAKLTLGSSPNPLNPSTALNHGTSFVANHASAVSRLVRCAYDELATAYLMTPDQHLHIQLVNMAVRILHFVLFSPTGRQTSWQTKIAGINGGAHKFRVVMARLVFAEGREAGIDAGITGDTVRMATELLEESVTPDEVEDLLKVFEGDGVSSSKRAQAIGSTQR